MAIIISRDGRNAKKIEKAAFQNSDPMNARIPSRLDRPRHLRRLQRNWDFCVSARSERENSNSA